VQVFSLRHPNVSTTARQIGLTGALNQPLPGH
jgi:hypothetical protein